MNAAGIQAKINAAYGKAAKVLGASYQCYRAPDQSLGTEGGQPLGTEDGQPLMLEPASPIGSSYQTINASFNAEDMKYRKPNKYGHPTWYGVFDGTSVKVGDYLVGDSTYFVAAMQPLLPILMVECNRTVKVSRPAQPSGSGLVGYNGNVPNAEQVLMLGWPCSILQGTKGERNEVGLPDETRTPWWSILLPAVDGIIIKPSDIITDDLDRRYVVSSPELTDLGYRITAAMALT